MSKEWWELTEEEMADDKHAQAARQIAYVNTFYGSREGNTVLLDIKRKATKDYTPYSSEGSMALQAMESLITYIRACSGANVTTELAMIEAEAGAIEFENLEEGEE